MATEKVRVYRKYHRLLPKDKNGEVDEALTLTGVAVGKVFAKRVGIGWLLRVL